jgi:hypothetical protein
LKHWCAQLDGNLFIQDFERQQAADKCAWSAAWSAAVQKQVRSQAMSLTLCFFFFLSPEGCNVAFLTGDLHLNFMHSLMGAS